MTADRLERRLAAILAADVAAYSRLMGADEEGTLARLTAHRRELFSAAPDSTPTARYTWNDDLSRLWPPTLSASPLAWSSRRLDRRQLGMLTSLMTERVAHHGGRLFSRAGDGFLCEFPSTVNAVQAGFEIQGSLRALGKDRTDGFQLRLGIHLADAVVDGDDLLGDGVNIAARVEALADPGSVTITQPVFDQVNAPRRWRLRASASTLSRTFRSQSTSIASLANWRATAT